ncbi:MAG TPA: hypothetical protein VMA77_27685, partial [Solirubrobacteraceae bacterium]|nr:hypothetical protein [Solirubrobacteraceae bacterium]
MTGNGDTPDGFTRRAVLRGVAVAGAAALVDPGVAVARAGGAGAGRDPDVFSRSVGALGAGRESS